MHTFFRLRGFGLSVVPLAPCVVRRVGDGSDGRIAVEHRERLVILDPVAPERATDLELVAEVVESSHGGDWVLDFGEHTTAWPNHFAVATSDLGGVPFEWWGEQGSSVMLQGPFSPAPENEAMAAPGQTIVGQGTTDGARWVELHYEVDGEAWSQRHSILPSGLIVTAQALRGAERLVWPVADDLVRDLI